MRWEIEGIWDFEDIGLEPEWYEGYERTGCDLTKRANAFKKDLIPIYSRKIKDAIEESNAGLANELMNDLIMHMKPLAAEIIEQQNAKAFYIMITAFEQMLKNLGLFHAR